MDELPFIDDPQTFTKEVKRLIDEREAGKTKETRTYVLTKDERKLIWDKTDGNCHVCGRAVSPNNFEADHVRNHSAGGGSQVDNFLPACRTCNNYRWHYSPEEVQWILKMGIWAKTKVSHDDAIGKLIAKEFIKKEIGRESRRKNPRIPMKG